MKSTILAKTELQEFEKLVPPIIKEANSYVIDSIEAIDTASLFLKKIKDVETYMENKRLEFTQPLNQSLKAINDNFRELKTPLEDARILLTNKILTWKRAETERLEKEEARRRAIQEAHEKAGHEVNAPIIVAKPQGKIGYTQTSKYWTFEVVDFSKLPDLWKSVNEVAIRDTIRTGVREIPGLKIYQEDRLSIVRG